MTLGFGLSGAALTSTAGHFKMSAGDLGTKWKASNILPFSFFFTNTGYQFAKTLLLFCNMISPKFRILPATQQQRDLVRFKHANLKLNASKLKLSYLQTLESHVNCPRISFFLMEIFLLRMVIDSLLYLWSDSFTINRTSWFHTGSEPASVHYKMHWSTWSLIDNTRKFDKQAKTWHQILFLKRSVLKATLLSPTNMKWAFPDTLPLSAGVLCSCVSNVTLA